jgi:hypothetical protein
MEKNDRESGEKGGAKEWMKFSSALPLLAWCLGTRLRLIKWHIIKLKQIAFREEARAVVPLPN